jgi:hypothetical protein
MGQKIACNSTVAGTHYRIRHHAGEEESIRWPRMHFDEPSVEIERLDGLLLLFIRTRGCSTAK